MVILSTDNLCQKEEIAMQIPLVGPAYRGIVHCAQSGCRAIMYIGSLPFRKHSDEELVFHSYPPFLFVWPVIVTGILFWWFRSWTDGSEYAGWFYITTMFISLLTMGVDLSRNESVFAVLVIALIGACSGWFDAVQGIPVMGNIIGYFRHLDVHYNAAGGYSLSIILGIVFLIMRGKVTLDDRWRISHNQIEHVVKATRDGDTARGAKGIVFDFPDILELLIAGSGTIHVLTAQGAPQMKIGHVPGLFWKRKKIQRLFNAIQVDATMADEEIHEDPHAGCEDTHEPTLQ